MGYIELPNEPLHAGHLKVSLQLDATELEGIAALLKTALQHPDLTAPGRDNSAALANGTLPAPISRHTSKLPQTSSAPSHTSAAAPAPVSAAAPAHAPAQAPPAQHAQQVQQPPAQPQQSQPRAPLPLLEQLLPRSAQPAALQHVQQPSRPAAQPILPPPQPQLAAAPAPVRTASFPAQQAPAGISSGLSGRPAQPQVPAPAIRWRVCCTTAADEHNNQPIDAMVYTPAIPGLAGGDGHAGWVVTASQQLLNLYECNPGGGADALMMMHSQATEFRMVDLQVEGSQRLLLGASKDMATRRECVSLHSLDINGNFMGLAGRLGLPPANTPQAAAPPSASQLATQVASLHHLGKPLAHCCAAAYGNSIVVYPTTIVPGEIPKQKAIWAAHSAPITSLRCSAFGMHMVSGAADGTVHLWDLRNKPTAPASRFQQRGPVTGVHLLNDASLATCSRDASLQLWDVRRPATPVHTVTSPDNRGIVRMAASVIGDTLAFASEVGGIYVVDLIDMACTLTTVAAAGRQPVQSLTWNSRTGHILAASQSLLVVYTQH